MYTEKNRTNIIIFIAVHLTPKPTIASNSTEWENLLNYVWPTIVQFIMIQREILKLSTDRETRL